MNTDPGVDLWALDEVHFQQYGSRCRLWVPPEDKDPILLHHTSGAVDASSDDTIGTSQTIPDIKLWSPEAPYLYNVYTELVVEGAILDVVKTPTGFRLIAKKDGHFLLNGKEIRPIGAALLPRSEYDFYTSTDA
jgi:hypothetical protein